MEYNHRNAESSVVHSPIHQPNALLLQTPTKVAYLSLFTDIEYLTIIAYPLPLMKHNKRFHKRSMRQINLLPISHRKLIKFLLQCIRMYCQSLILCLHMLDIELRTPIRTLILYFNLFLFLLQTLEFPISIYFLYCVRQAVKQIINLMQKIQYSFLFIIFI